MACELQNVNSTTHEEIVHLLKTFLPLIRFFCVIFMVGNQLFITIILVLWIATKKLKIVRLNSEYKYHALSQGWAMEKDIRETAGTWSLIWSIGKIPLRIISAFVDTNEGNTRPGQSHSNTSSLTYSVWNKEYKSKHASTTKTFLTFSFSSLANNFNVLFATPDHTKFLRALHWNLMKLGGKGGNYIIDRSAKYLKVLCSSRSCWNGNLLVIQKSVDCGTFSNIRIPNL